MPQGAILTTIGRTKLNSASPESQLNVTHYAVGDGSGGYVTLTAGMTELVNEVWRGSAMAPTRDPNNDATLIFKAIIPIDTGGFTIREMAIFDEDGDMIAICQTTAVEKADLSSPFALNMTAKMRVRLNSAAEVNLFAIESSPITHNETSGRSAADSHPMSAITGLVADLSAKQTAIDGKAAAVHGHSISDVTGLSAALDGKSDDGHGHSIGEVSGLTAALDGKSDDGHGHSISDVSGLSAALAAIRFPEVQRRQCVLSGNTDSNGLADFVSASSLTATIHGATVPVRMAFANGFDEYGAVDYVGSLTADENITLPSLNGTHYLYADRNPTTGAITFGSTPVPPQYTRGVGVAMASLLHFDDNLLDAYAGSGWGSVNLANISADTAKFGAKSLKLSGANSSYMLNTSFMPAGRIGSGWTVDFWFKRGNTTGTQQLFSAVRASGNNYGIGLRIISGTNKVAISLSSNNGSNDLANNVVGTGPAIDETTTWHHVEASYDGTTYRLFVDGTLVWSLVSATPVGDTAYATIGADGTAGKFYTGYIDEFRASIGARNMASFTPPAAAYSVDQSWDVFRIDRMQMIQQGLAAGAVIQRLYLGQVTLESTEAVSYAIQGRAQSAYMAVPAAGAQASFRHNLGMPAGWSDYRIKNISPEYSYLVGDVVNGPVSTAGASITTLQPRTDHAWAYLRTSGTGSMVLPDASSGASSTITPAKWQLQFDIDRDW